MMPEGDGLLVIAGSTDLNALRWASNGNGHFLADCLTRVASEVHIHTECVIIGEKRTEADEKWVVRTATVLSDAIKALVETNRRKDAAALCAALSDHVGFYGKRVSGGRSQAIASALLSAQRVLLAPKPRPPIDQITRFRIFSRDGFRCQYCGRDAQQTKLTIDHRVAVANGGSSDDSNLLTACMDCNGGKGSMDAASLSVVEATP